MKIRYTDHRELGTCPAAVDMDNGTIEINRTVWRDYDNFQQRFIIAHEEGHFKLQTDSETEADRYALHKVYGTAERSLKRSIDTLYKVGIVNENRYLSLYKEALKIDWEQNGNINAKNELEFLKQNSMKAKSSTSNYIQAYSVQPQEDKKRAYRAFADGGEETSTAKTTCQNKSHKTNGVKVGDYYFSFTNIMLALIFIYLVFTTKKG